MNKIKYSFTFGSNDFPGVPYYDPISEVKCDPYSPLPIDEIKEAVELAYKYKKMSGRSLIYKKPSKGHRKTSHRLKEEIISERERKEEIKEFNRDMNTAIFDYLKAQPLVYYLYHMGDNWNLIFKKVTINWTETNTNNIMMPVERARSENFLIAFIVYWGDEKVDCKDVTKEIVDSCPKFKVRSENHAIEVIRGMGR